MKVKTLRSKSSGNYLHFTLDEHDDVIMVERSLPDILQADVTLEGLLDHYAMTFPYLDTTDFDVVELDLIETGVVGADIRNKLTPVKNLIATVEAYLNEKSSGKKIIMKGHIEKDIRQVRITIEYLTKLL